MTRYAVTFNILTLSYVAYETAKELAEEKETKKEQKEVRKGNQ